MYGSRGEGSFQPRTTAPVKVGDELEVTIEAEGAKGDGIAKKEGFVLFVPGVHKGDNVRIRVTKVLRKVGFAEVAGASGESNEDETQETPEEAPAKEESEEPQETPEEENETPAEDSEDFGEDK